ncbi:hypothetical protein ACJJTC_001290 [Scirpophaga incertulas]
MWRRILILFLFLYVFVTLTMTAPLYNGSQGPRYVVSSPDSSGPFVEVHNATYRGAGPREEARATCSVRTHEVNATANATITRRLHGVATSRELHNSIQRLEVIIYGQMQQLWQTLDALRAQLAGNGRPTYPDRRTMSFRIKPGM